ncbi:MAG: hypothetical protein ABI171_14155 [Collimonas sp.]|uniref:hypothetical protein n=1 Tax=Collimonas sp. TaxID=1963772 RepID=UPI003263B4B2
MKLLMHVCLNSLLAFAMAGVVETIQPAFNRFNAPYRVVLAFLAGLVIMFCLLTGLILGAFHE